jgi:hypothetical protein
MDPSPMRLFTVLCEYLSGARIPSHNCVVFGRRMQRSTFGSIIALLFRNIENSR